MNLEQHLLRQMAFSRATYGPGARTSGVIDHIRKELVEVEESNGDAKEWVDVVILALDGLTRELEHQERTAIVPLDACDRVDYVVSGACQLIKEKQAVNEQRDWPDWRTADVTKAIEHVR